MSDDHFYTYGITDDTLELDVEGVGGASHARTIEQGGLFAVVTEIGTLEPERSDENLRAHDDVLQDVLHHEGGRTVVPMQFGMVFKNARTLKNVLRNGRRAFRKALNDVEGTIELGVKLVAGDDATIDRQAVVASVSERLAEASVSEAENGLFSDRLVLNRSYLVERDEQMAFDEAVDAVTDEYADELTVQYTGPWAPYSFVDIQIGATQ